MSRAWPLLLAALATAPVAHAAEVPVAWWMNQIRREFARTPHLRLEGEGWRVALRTAVVDSAGIRWETPSQVVRSEGAGLPDGARAPIEWERIAKVQTGRPGTTRGLLYGAFLGTAAAVAVAVADEPRADDADFRRVALPAVMIAGGGGLGWIVGANTLEWRTFYPPP